MYTFVYISSPRMLNKKTIWLSKAVLSKCIMVASEAVSRKWWGNNNKRTDLITHNAVVCLCACGDGREAKPRLFSYQ